MKPIFGAIVGDIAGSTFEATKWKLETCETFRAGSNFTSHSALDRALNSINEEFWEKFGTANS